MIQKLSFRPRRAIISMPKEDAITTKRLEPRVGERILNLDIEQALDQPAHAPDLGDTAQVVTAGQLRDLHRESIQLL
ncbi:MAG: hypothetical protein BGP17_08750 [Sphingomonas sp. 67-41]|nr:MAG: hypothetical protein BGP17_08750 [Sphingomonas sp. 67-41]